MYMEHSILYSVKCVLYLPKIKNFDCVGRGDLTSLFFSKVAKLIEVRGDLSNNKK